MNWQPINWNKPPKGLVLLYFPPEGEIRNRPGHPRLEAWIKVDHASAGARKPTHFMPLPPPPEAA